MIFQYLPDADLKQARLVSRFAKGVRDKPLLRSIVLDPSTRSLVRLSVLWKVSTIGRYIRKLIMTIGGTANHGRCLGPFRNVKADSNSDRSLA